MSRTRLAPCFAALAALAALLAGCGRQAPATAAAAPPNASADPNGPSLFTIPAAQMTHLSLYTVAPTTLVRTLRLPGTVVYNGFHTTAVITQVGGRVTRILAQPGEHVRAGQPMLYVSSPDYSADRAAFLKARDAFQLADKNYRRAQDLYEHQAIAEADLLQAASARTQAEADFQNAEQALRILGVADPAAVAARPSPDIPVLAPISGLVVDREAMPGQVVQAGSTQLFTLSDLHTVWVLVNVFERDLAYVHVGDPVTVHSDAYGRDFHGRISYLGASLDPTSRTLQARIVTRNPGEELKNQMYVTAVVQAGVERRAIAVPDAAVLRDDVNQPFVYVAVPGRTGTFARRLVQIGESEAGRTQILSGLQPGERVIAEGSLFVQFANSLQ
ncbi:MAG TPA: efflux RND transporter periplasmic adaptor subunit [Terriglobales bacterium]|nr:efflux RND transporter periplasmic adaptor subunit [Terriglobales bacterium]